MDRELLHGTRMLEREGELDNQRDNERIAHDLEHGLPSAESIQDRSIPLFHRGRNKYSASGTYMGRPFLEDMRKLGGQDVAIVGAPLDAGATYRSGTRFGPQAMRRISAEYTQYSFELGLDL